MPRVRILDHLPGFPNYTEPWALAPPLHRREENDMP